MAVLQAIIAIILRSLSRLMNTVFGWATVMLFGRVPRRRHTTLIAMLAISIAWLICVVGVASPAVAVFLLAFAQLPEDFGAGWLRLALLAAVLLLPLLVGVLTWRLPHAKIQLGLNATTLRSLMHGYSTTLGLGLTLVMMTVIVPAIKLRTVVQRRTSQHVPMIVDAPDYLHVVAELQATLQREGWRTEQCPMSWTLRIPTVLMAMLAGRTLERRVAERLITLRSPKLEVVLHPSGALIRGSTRDVVRVRAAIVEHLAFSRAYMTWDRAGHAIEDQLTALWSEVRSGARSIQEGMEGVARIEQALRSADISYDEWEILNREMLLIERALLRAVVAEPQRSASVPAEQRDELRRVHNREDPIEATDDVLASSPG